MAIQPNNNQCEEIGKKRFRGGREDADDDARVHPPIPAPTDANVTCVLGILRHAVRMVADKLNIGTTTVYSIWVNDLVPKFKSSATILSG